MTNDELIQYIRDGIAELRRTGLRYKLTGDQVRQAYAVGHRDFRGAYLSGVNLRSAYLKGANLHGAYLEGANLFRANLHGAVGIICYIDIRITAHEIFVVDGDTPMLKAGCEWLPLVKADVLLDHEDVHDRARAGDFLAYLKKWHGV